MSYSLPHCGNPSSLRRYLRALVSSCELQHQEEKVERRGQTLLSLALQGMPKTIFSTNADTSNGKKKIGIQNFALQCREKTDQTSAVQLYSDPTKTLDHTPSFPSHTQNMRQSAEDGNCGVTEHGDQC